MSARVVGQTALDLQRVESDEDIDAFLAVRRAIDPDNPIPRAAYVQHIVVPGRVDLLGRVDGEPVAGAFVEPRHGNLAGSTAYVSVRVLREHRRRGIGTALFCAVSTHARASGWSALHSVARHDDADTIDYLGKRSFVEVSRMQQLSLEVKAADPELRPLPGVRIAPLGPEHEQGAYLAAQEIYPDIPEEDDFWVGPFDEWRRDDLPDHVIRECTFVALADGVVVGYATLLGAGDGVGLHGISGVLPAWRGRGIATALKQAQIAAAQGVGLRELRTTTAATNAPMLRVNEGLGYRRGVAWVHLRGPLLDEGRP